VRPHGGADAVRDGKDEADHGQALEERGRDAEACILAISAVPADGRDDGPRYSHLRSSTKTATWEGVMRFAAKYGRCRYCDVASPRTHAENARPSIGMNAKCTRITAPRVSPRPAHTHGTAHGS
jgi:hypothetical protein